MHRLCNLWYRWKWYNVGQKGKPVMDWLLRPLIFVGLFAIIVSGRKCALDECSSKYRLAMEEARIIEPETTLPYCTILWAYRQCQESNTISCRGDLAFHSTEFLTRRLENEHCPRSSDRSGPSPSKASPSKPPHRDPSSQGQSLRPSCKYFGTFKFRHCSLFGDPHLKTFDGRYQTCRVNGTWVLINNTYISVHVTNRPVVENSAVTAPTKITVVVKSSSTPCTLEKRYSADSQYSLPSTFDDGTDRPGADQTVSLTFRQDSGSRETVEIFVKYIATRLVIRRVGRYLAFSARLPEEVFQMSRAFDDDDEEAAEEGAQSPELCATGCPAAEQLDIAAAHDYVMGREQALAECNGSARHLDDELRNRLTDNYLDWCMFDLMSSGTVYDFVAVAHAAQADALDADAQSLMNRTKPIDLISAQRKSQTATGAAATLAPRHLPTLAVCWLATLARLLS